MRIEIEGEEAEAFPHDGTWDSIRRIAASGILCSGVVDRDGSVWITFLSPIRGLVTCPPGTIVIRFETNEHVPLHPETFENVATVLDDENPAE